MRSIRVGHVRLSAKGAARTAVGAVLVVALVVLALLWGAPDSKAVRALRSWYLVHTTVSLTGLTPEEVRRLTPLDYARLCARDDEASLPAPVAVPAPVAMIPSDLYCLYTLGGLVAVTSWFLNDKSNAGYTGATWSTALVDELRTRARRRETYIYHQTDAWMFEALDAHPVQGKDVGVFGSMTPWYEALMLERGAKSVTTVEYNRIQTDYPAFHTVLATEFWASSPRASFDVVVAISSFEHDGLARYGDPLDPFGDVHAMARLRTVVRPGGFAFVAVPECTAADGLVFNAHRIYGPVRMPLLLEGWETVAIVGNAAAELFPADQVEERRLLSVEQPVRVLRPVV